MSSQPSAIATASNVQETELDRLRRENEALKAKQAQPQKGLTMKIGDKGGLSVYGLGRFPVTLYKEQWIRLLDIAGDIMDFIQKHDAQLKTKD